jgi:ubiquinone/menaquinone biosynthesis C-methylase UbiE
MNETRYVLATGEEAARRLKVVNGVHGPDTRAFLMRAGLAPGMRVADIGCGTGVVADWIAEQIGPSGEVVGVDISPDQVEQALAAARERGRTNVTFQVESAHATGLPRGGFDLVFSRFMLMHVPDPAAAVRELAALVRPGGVLALEDGDFQSPFCEPPLPAFDRCFALYRAVVAARGADPLVGPKLYRMALDADFERPEVTLAQPVFTSGEEKRLPEWTLEECLPAITGAGLATEEEVRSLARELANFARDETTLIGMARMTQVWARKRL